MIIYSKPEKLQTEHRLILYDATPENEIKSRLQPGLFSELVDSSYQQHFIWESQLRKKLIENTISPIAYYQKIQGIETSDLASRTRIRSGKVRKHLTPDGFLRADIRELIKYAVVFGINVADFFSIFFVDIELLQINDNSVRKTLQIMHAVKPE